LWHGNRDSFLSFRFFFICCLLFLASHLQASIMAMRRSLLLMVEGTD
jgi:hypothetical protein